jgi:hypothetical protein
MKAIQIAGAALFVSDGTLTVRLLPNGECGPSPIMYEVLEWDLRTEPPETWYHLSERELQALPDYARIEAAFQTLYDTLGLTKGESSCS